MKRAVSFLALLALTSAPALTAAPEKAKRPRLDLRAAPRMAFSPVNILLTAELQGGDDLEEYYCPELEWDWDDGGKSVQEADCDPFEAGTTKIDRRFTAEHEYRRSGTYSIKVTLRKAERPIAVANVKVTVRPGASERTTADPFN